MVHFALALFIATVTLSEHDQTEMSMIQTRATQRNKLAQNDDPPKEEFEEYEHFNQIKGPSVVTGFKAALQGMAVQAVQLQTGISSGIQHLKDGVFDGLLQSLGCIVEKIGNMMNAYTGNAEIEYTLRAGNAYSELGQTSKSSLPTAFVQVQNNLDDQLIHSAESYLRSDFERSAKMLIMLDKVAQKEETRAERILLDLKTAQNQSHNFDTALWNEVEERQKKIGLVLKDILPRENEQSHRSEDPSLKGFHAAIHGMGAQAMQMQTGLQSTQETIMREGPSSCFDRILQGMGAIVEQIGNYMNQGTGGGITYTLRAGNAHHERTAEIPDVIEIPDEFDIGEELLQTSSRFIINNFKRGAAILILLDKANKGEAKNLERVWSDLQRIQDASLKLDATLEESVAERRERVKLDLNRSPP